MSCEMREPIEDLPPFEPSPNKIVDAFEFNEPETEEEFDDLQKKKVRIILKSALY